MATYTAFTTLSGEAAASELGEALELLEPAPTGIGVFEIEDGSGLWEIGGYFVDPPDRAGLAILATIHQAKDFVVSKLDDRDWVAQVRRELTPVEAGRFVVYGAHDEDNIPRTKIGLRIEAAMAFGTGHHGTTQGCLLLLDHLVTTGFVPMSVADVGTGTGVLGMAAARVWPARTIASDIDPVATETATANIRANGFGRRIQTVTSVGFRHDSLRRMAPYGLVFANILARPLKRLAPDMARFTAPGSKVILSGLLNTQAAGTLSVYEGHGFSLQKRERVGEWSSLLLHRH